MNYLLTLLNRVKHWKESVIKKMYINYFEKNYLKKKQTQLLIFIFNYTLVCLQYLFILFIQHGNRP